MTTIGYTPATTSSRGRGALWTGRVLTALCVLFLLFDAIAHIARPASVVDAFARLGFPLSLAVPLGIIELACIAVYVVPATTVFGAVLLTGYLGGAVATNLRAGSPFWSEALFPVYFGILIWAGLVLRDRGVLALLLGRRS